MKFSLLILMILSFLQTMLQASSENSLEVGAPAPSLSAQTDTGESLDLGQVFSEGTTLVFFYPKAMTPGCTRQACSLRDAWDTLSNRQVRIFGVSSDPAETQAAFREKHSLPFTLLADTDGTIADAFGKGRWSRQAYIIRDGVVVWRDLKASTSDQAADVLAALDALPAAD